MAITVVPRGKSGGQQFTEALNPFLILAAQRRIAERAEEKKSKEKQDEQVANIAVRLMENDPDLSAEEAFDQSEFLITGAFGVRTDEARIAEFNALKSDKKKRQFLDTVDPGLRDFINRRSTDLDLPEEVVETAKVSPFSGLGAFTPEQAPQIAREVGRQVPQILKEAATPRVPQAQQAVAGLQNIPQVPIQAAAGLEQAIVPPQLQFLTQALQAPQQVLNAPPIQDLIKNAPRNLDISGRALGLGFQQGAQDLFNFLPENIRNIIKKGRRQTGSPGAF